jgi:hypothetical protein
MQHARAWTEMHITFGRKPRKGKADWGTLDRNDTIKSIVKIYGGKMWIRFIWLGIGTSGRLL